MSSRLLSRSSRRSWLRHPLQLGLSILGVAMGVAVAVSVDLANESAREAFRVSTEAVTGRTTHQIVGGSAGVSEDLYRRIRMEAGFRSSAPVVDGWVDGPDGRPLRVFGIDPLAEAGVRRPLAAAARGGGLDLATVIGVPDVVFVTEATADLLGLADGDSFTVRADGVDRVIVLGGRLAPNDGLGSEGLRDVLVTDVSTAQELLGRVGRLDRIDLVVGDDSRLVEVRALLPGDVVLTTAAARAGSTLEMTRAFALNLQAMSLLAVVCGVFLIYNTMTFSVVRRRPLIGQLRVLGVTRREVFRLILREAMWIGVIGTALGLLGGWILAGGMVRLVTQTINDLYFTVAVRSVTPEVASLVRAGLLGVVATLVAALAPAREATRTQPRAVLQRSDIETRARTLIPRLALTGAAMTALGALLVWLPGRSLLVAFAGLFLLLLGASFATPAATWALARALAPGLRRFGGLLGALAARGVTANLSRTAVAVAALMIAVSVIIGVGVMVTSFRASLVSWLGYTLQADLYVTPVGDPGAGRALRLPPEQVEELRASPDIEGISTIRAIELALPDRAVQLLVLDPGPFTRDSYELVGGDEANAWERFESGAALVSEPYAFRADVRAGDVLRLPAPEGSIEVEIAGVFRSYASDRGAVMIHRATYDRHWDDPAISGLSLDLRSGADVEAIRGRLEQTFAGRQRVTVISNGELREQSLVVFDRTFLITGVLRVLVSLVAFVGVFAALMAMALERSRELGILRATGLTPRQMFALVTAQTGLLGLIAGLLALPLGVVLAWVMIHVINRRSFGWSLDMQVPGDVLVEALLIAVGAALLAGVWPALRRAGGLPAAALREE